MTTKPISLKITSEGVLIRSQGLEKIRKINKQGGRLFAT